MSTACFTGHRSVKLPWGADEDDIRCRMMKLRLISAVFAVYERGCTHFISGMAEGVDIIAAEAVLKLKESCPEVTLECALPCPGAGRTRKNAQRYERILSLADRVTVLAGSYFRTGPMQRNCYMVDNSSIVIAVYAGEPGGTEATIAYAKKQGREIMLIDIGGARNLENGD